MERIKVLAITFLTAFLLFRPHVYGEPQQPSQRPLCVSQLALANYACGRLSPISSASQPESSSSSNVLFPDDHMRHRHRHRHRHEGRHYTDTPSDDCCRWLNDLDDECICQLLIRLPPFLSRPLHKYNVVIGDSCNVTFTCNAQEKH